MVEPVAKTSRRAILPVLIEVSILTFLLGFAMNAIPGLRATEDMLRAMGNHFIGPEYGKIISVASVSAAFGGEPQFRSCQYSVYARQGQGTAPVFKLNRFGMPWFSLIVARLFL